MDKQLSPRCVALGLWCSWGHQIYIYLCLPVAPGDIDASHPHFQEDFMTKTHTQTLPLSRSLSHTHDLMYLYIFIFLCCRCCMDFSFFFLPCVFSYRCNSWRYIVHFYFCSNLLLYPGCRCGSPGWKLCVFCSSLKFDIVICGCLSALTW